MRVGTQRGFFRAWLVKAASAAAVSCVLAGCSKLPATLRIVSGPPQANEQIAAMLASGSEQLAAPVHLTAGEPVAGGDEALAALAAGRADLAIVENSAGYRYPTARTVAPLYPSVLHIGIRPEKRAETLAQVLRGATVYAGTEETPARQLLERMKSLYGWRGIEFSYVDSLESRPDVVFVFAPLTPRAAPLLDGYRGAEPTDLAAMEELVRRVGKLAEDLPEVRALTLEPVLAAATGVSVVGARVVLGQPPRRDDTGPRRMR